MKSRRWFVLVVAIVAVGVGYRLRPDPLRYTGRRPYCAAFVTRDWLVVFPFNAPKVVVPLPFSAMGVFYSPSGDSIYAGRENRAASAGLFRIDLKSRQATPVAGSSNLSFHSLAIAPDESRIFISGAYRNGGQTECGIFELETATGTVRTVPVSGKPDCDYLHTWHNLSLSPDGRRAVAFRKVDVEPEIFLINLESGAVTSLGWGWRAAWSPDGRWIALLDVDNVVTILDATEPSRKERFGRTESNELTWSPDSRYLLLWNPCLRALGYFGTLEALDARTGRTESIASSRCSVDLMTTGWVSEEVIKNR